MAQPTVVYPPWLTPIPSVITDAAGSPVETSTSVSYLPPVYYGPSIPLGSLYSYGGYSFPPSIQLPGGSTATSTTEPPITTSATPTTSLTTSATPSVSTTATPSTSSVSSSLTSFSSSPSTSSLSTSSPSSSSTVLTSSSTTSAAPTSTAGGIPQATGLTKAQLVGVIVASILGLIFLFVLALFLFLWWKARRNRRQYRTLSPIDDDYIIVPSGGRSPGEGSPRQSGEETDSFLQRRGQTAAVTQTSGDLPTRAYTARVPPPTTNSNSSDSTNSHASGFGVLLERPTIQFLPSMPENEQSSGQQLSETEMERLGRENVIPDDNAQYQDPEYSGPYAYAADLPPPRLVDPVAAPLLSGLQPPYHPNDSLGSKGSLAGEHPEEATVHMARRVKVEDLGSRSNSRDETTAGPSRRSSAGALLSALGLGALANLGRKSWFKNFDTPLPPHPEPESRSYLAEPLSEKDIEAGQYSLHPPDRRAADSFGNRPRGAAAVGTGPDGSRPISSTSGLSAASGGTQFFDARSRPGTPGTPILTPLPRAMTPVEQPVPAVPQMAEHVWLSSPLAGPPAYEEPTRPFSTHSPNRSQASLTMPPRDLDILDMPAPTALNNFASISSLKETATGSSFGIKVPPFPPPGLGAFGALDTTIRPVGWASSETGTEASDSRGGSFGYSSGRIAVHDLPFDVLEEAPPEAEQGWRTIATGGFGDSGRGTFGTLVQGPEFTSEQGSLHSMRSHLNQSNRSSGSAPVSYVAGSINSNSSRAPSNGSASSNVHALMHKGSVSSDSRRRHAPVSPALSAFGVHPRGRSSPSPAASPGPSSLQHQLPFDRPHTPTTLIGSPPPVHMSPDKPRTINSIGSSATTVQGDTSIGTVKGVIIPAVPELELPERSASASPPLSAFGGAPWAGGLDRDWQPMP